MDSKAAATGATRTSPWRASLSEMVGICFSLREILDTLGLKANYSQAVKLLVSRVGAAKVVE